MLTRVLSLLVVALWWLPALALAQSASGGQAPPAASSTETDMQMEMLRKRHLVLPRPPMETVLRDADDARDAVEADDRRDALIREQRRRPLSRPELDYDITSGIQSRNVLRALRR